MKDKNKKIEVLRSKRSLYILVIVIAAILCITFIATSNKNEIDNTAHTMNLGSNIHIQSKMSTKIEPKAEVKNEDKTEDNKETKTNDSKEANTVTDNKLLVHDTRGVPVICYHSVVNDSSKKGPIAIPKEKFIQQLKTIKDNGFTTLTMSQLNDYLFNGKSIPQKSVVITFDDGYIDNYTTAFPILKELHMNATIFVVSNSLDGVHFMTPNEVKEMSDYGIDIESHTVSHHTLSSLSYEEQFKELKNSKEAIEKLTQKPVISVAYPEGKYNEYTKKAFLASGYSMGFTTARGYADKNDSPEELNRVCVDYTYGSKDIENVLNYGIK